MELAIGLTGESSTVVREDNTADAMGAGGVRVFATPAMISLMENAAFAAVQPMLPAGKTSVGALVNVQHLAATPLGMRVRAFARLIAVDGRRLTFEVEAYDERELIGKGIHERQIVTLERFMERVNEKAHQKASG
jgi:fluoroacetyl-CoA thioesterase